MHSAGGYTPYEIDVNKRVRHANETHIENKTANLKEEIKLEQPSIAIKEEPEKKESGIVNITERSNKQDQNSVFNKFWNWATQLF